MANTKSEFSNGSVSKVKRQHTSCLGHDRGDFILETESVLDRAPDVEVIFRFNGEKSRYITDGYRPAHLIKDGYLTTGIHHYYNTDLIPSNGTATGTITFITPEAYPHCLWKGKCINIQEGGKIVGYATILHIYNKLLELK